MTEKYNNLFNTIAAVERIQKDLIEDIKEKLSVKDSSTFPFKVIQIVYYIGASGRDKVSLLEIRKVLGTANFFYAWRLMCSKGYASETPNALDKRAHLIKLSAKGIDLYNKILTSLDKKKPLEEYFKNIKI